ncbi:4-(cytidine 5'-diphospho)-2-C-methyl-D-erythritol kinase [Bulleidia sp. zg-1006]|uniref:4-(cytidine 5'-diphospho)-2-C-methyl-D-erythritol kinase n=1 Tax=Bulleidia sp. zg-1006 TaxID=2806552 RepID=UPI00193A1602|nr:4-(cytidine 5'-diphospho)-2-C-methyl-D-erythritol kinase [Bulleidia sp. zg-1006]QRG86773.1 4-(cytidine 5'-diphospho)-2-C-methyl-D-erythritol kinase [Bulleidia sp. zg-1006]
MRDRAYAKINLALEVGSTRLDGYHDLRMVMVPIDFYDQVEIVPSDVDELICNKGYIPLNPKNTMYQALTIIRNRYNIEDKFSISLQKQLPVRAGLAGGSADAAAVIRLLNRMLKLNMSRKEMIEIALDVGSDVPFCLFNQACIVEGKGEILTPIEVNLNFELLLVKPKNGVSTKKAFQLIGDEDKIPLDILPLARALKESDYDTFLSGLGNHLESVAIRLVPEIQEVKQELLELGFDASLMSGSGSTVFGITKSADLTNSAFKKLRRKGYFVRRTHVLKG